MPKLIARPLVGGWGWFTFHFGKQLNGFPEYIPQNSRWMAMHRPSAWHVMSSIARMERGCWWPKTREWGWKATGQGCHALEGGGGLRKVGKEEEQTAASQVLHVCATISATCSRATVVWTRKPVYHPAEWVCWLLWSSWGTPRGCTAKDHVGSGNLQN